jgi:hypothetical protein
MKGKNQERSIDYHLFYGLAIIMVSLSGIFMRDSLGSGPICSPCDMALYPWGGYIFDYCTGTLKCTGPVADSGACFGCDTSNPQNPQLTYKCHPETNCKDCNWIPNPNGCISGCSICTGCSSNNCNIQNCETCDGHGNCMVCGGDSNKCCIHGENGLRCDTVGDWKNPASVVHAFAPYIRQKVQDALNRIPGVNVTLTEVQAEYAENHRDCCSHGTLNFDGEGKGEGTGTLSANIDDVTLWGPPRISRPFNFGFAVIRVDFDAGVKLSADFSASGTIGNRYNYCKEEFCPYGSLGVDVTWTCDAGVEAILCAKTRWTSEKCAGIDITLASVEVQISGNLRCNSGESCDGCTGDLTFMKIEFVATFKCNGVGVEFRYTIDEGGTI